MRTAGQNPSRRCPVGDNLKMQMDQSHHVGRNCRISPAGKPREVDHPLYYVRDGIVIIPKNGVVPHETRI